MSRPAVSVVIPTYQSARFVGEAIESALEQDEPPHEVVVVDDGSTDDTPEVLAGFGDRIVVVTHPENRSVAAARNTGLGAVTGDIVMMLDADDRMLPGRIRTAVDELFDGGDDLGVVLGAQQMFGLPEGATVPAWALDTDGRPISHCPSQVNAWRWVYDRVGGHEESFDVGDDSDWLVRVRAAGIGIKLLDQPLTHRRIHTTNITETFSDRSRAEYLRSIRNVVRSRRGDA